MSRKQSSPINTILLFSASLDSEPDLISVLVGRELYFSRDLKSSVA